MDINIILDQIKQGETKVKWIGYVFSGGRDWGNWDTFALYGSDGSFDYLEISDHAWVIYVNSKRESVSKEDVAFCDQVYAVVSEAVIRDDLEFIKIVGSTDGIPNYPRDFGDISREQVLSGEYVVNV